MTRPSHQIGMSPSRTSSSLIPVSDATHSPGIIKQALSLPDPIAINRRLMRNNFMFARRNTDCERMRERAGGSTRYGKNGSLGCAVAGNFFLHTRSASALTSDFYRVSQSPSYLDSPRSQIAHSRARNRYGDRFSHV